ncbi:hypothetical protein GCM10025861_16120 [Methanobacterium petrolearium]|nr:hypothetical protein GCM10025861_16120 [Methanobacterium petrolearium]
MSLESMDSSIANIIRKAYPEIEELNPAQEAVLDAGFLDDPENFIIAIPTASGKTL